MLNVSVVVIVTITITYNLIVKGAMGLGIVVIAL